MKLETSKSWEEALRWFGKAEELLKDGKISEAERWAMFAVIWGYDAITKLSEELKMPDLSVIALDATSDWWERRTGKHHTPQENINWARRSLKKLSDITPQDTFPPFRY